MVWKLVAYNKTVASVLFKRSECYRKDREKN